MEPGPRTTRSGRSLGTTLPAVALVVAAVAVVAVGVTLTWRPQSGPTPTPSATYPTTPPPSGPNLAPGVTPTPTPPSATSLEEFVADEVGGLGWEGAGADDDALGSGATDAERGTYAADDQRIDAALSEWPTPEAAEAHARARAARDFPGAQPLADGPIASGAGHFWYFERDGRGTVFWYHGRFSAQFSGDPHEVQDFFLRFPR